uniref:Uncharacterized protein n=1 Tax=uncultured bacterium Pu17 TaxID=139002 RepID=Q99IY5_9BACT|nr:unknown [uncultured bacterium Pu17]
MLKPITFKVKEKLFLIGQLLLSEEELLKSLGEPHYIETDNLRTCGGPQWFWGFVEDEGSMVAIDFHPLGGHVKVGTNRPNEVDKLLTQLRIRNEALSKYDQLYDYYG